MTHPINTTNVYVGRPIERLEDMWLLRGKGRFVDDLTRDQVLRGAVLRSPIAHGTIRSIDTTAAKAMPGVHAVFTAADIGKPMPHIPIRLFPDDSLIPYLQPVLANGIVRYVGDPMAFVVADTAAIAEDAIDAIEFDIEPLPVLMNCTVAEKDEPLLFAGTPSNAAIVYTAEMGDVEAAFRDAPYVRRERMAIQRHFACPMEPRGVLAEWDRETQRMLVLGAAKVPFQNRRILSSLMGIPEDAIDMIEGDTGGGFGARGEFYPEDFLVPYAARLLGRPVQWTEDRREHLMATNHSRESDCDLEIACELDGTIRGMRGTAWIDGGGYIRTHAGTNAYSIALALTGAFRVPNSHIVTRMVLTNKTPIGTFRGPGRYESDFFRERLFDIAARDLGIDRVEFRRRNLVPKTAMPYAFPEVVPHGQGDQLDCGDYLEPLEAVAKEIGWEEKRAIQGKLVDGRYHGIGIGCFVEAGASGPSENARMVLEKDGRISLYVGSSAVGQGLVTILTQIAADALEVPMEMITLSQGSTTGVKSGFGSFGSRSTVMGGTAVLVTAQAFRDAIRKAGAARLGCATEETEIVDAKVRGPNGKSVTFAELGSDGITVEETFVNSKRTWAYGTAAAHVAVDAETGHVEILDYMAVEDVGRIVNPLTLRGQLIGSIVQGLGGALLEHLVYDEQGQLLTGTFADYLLPLATDFPTIRGYETENYPSPLNPMGIKGGGEGGIISVGGVIANAVAAALESFGVEPLELPMSPPRVWQLIEDARQRKAAAE